MHCKCESGFRILISAGLMGTIKCSHLDKLTRHVQNHRSGTLLGGRLSPNTVAVQFSSERHSSIALCWHALHRMCIRLCRKAATGLDDPSGIRGLRASTRETLRCVISFSPMLSSLDSNRAWLRFQIGSGQRLQRRSAEQHGYKDCSEVPVTSLRRAEWPVKRWEF